MIIEIFLFFLIFLVYWAIKDGKPKGMPPGPFEIPFVGNVALENCTQLKKYREKYGTIYTTRFGRIRTVTLTDYQMAKTVMASQDFADRSILFKLFQIDIDETGGVIASNGLQWVHDRRFVLRHLRDLGMGKTYLEVAVQEEAQALVDYFKSLEEKPVNFPKGLRTAVLNVILQLVAGKRYDLNSSSEVDVIFELFEDFRNESWIMFLPYFFPVFKMVPNSLMNMFVNTKLMANFRVQMKDIIVNWIEDHKKNLDVNNPRDLIDSYLIDMEKSKDDPENLFRVEALIEIVDDLFAAGSDTVTNMLRWVIYYMHKYPEATKRCQEEIDNAVAPDSLVSIEDKSRLPYVEAYLAEAFRHSSLIHMNVQRTAIRNCNIGGYFIPKGTEVAVDNMFIHYDPSFWDDPTVFKPERFIDEDGKFQAKLGRTFAFGSGRRQCLGEPLARMEFFLFSSALLQNFTIEVPEGCKVNDAVKDSFQTRFPEDQEFIYKLRK